MPRSTYLCLFVALVSCGAGKRAPEGVPSYPAADAYASAEARLEGRFLDRGMVVSLGADRDTGDSLIFSGIALAAMDCTRHAVAGGLRAATHDQGGALSRHPSIPGQVSLDGALGFYFGVAARLRKCPGEHDLWQGVMKEHLAYMATHHGEINTGVRVPAGFDFVGQALLANLGLAGTPSKDRLDALSAEVAIWAEAVRFKHAACYRVHLGWLALRTADILGYHVNRGGFCAAANGLGLAVIDHWCGRGGLQEFMTNFTFNTWNYKFQRCEAWEQPDGHGESPAVDYLLGYSELYQ